MQESYHTDQPPHQRRRKQFPPAQPGHKFCYDCEEEKALDLFRTSRGKPFSYCKVCAQKRDKERSQSYDRERHHRPRKPIAEVYTRGGYKMCPICEQELLYEAFPFRNGRPTGACKECARAKDRERNTLRRARKSPPNPKAIQEGHKVCNTCLKERPYTQFSPDSAQKDGYTGRCKKCRRTLNVALPDEEKERLRLLREVRDNAKREQIRERDRLRNQTEHTRLRHRAHNAQRRSRMVATVTETVDYKRILDRDGYHCYICNQAINPKSNKKAPDSLAFDHVLPLIPRQGEPQGTHSEDNIRPVHHFCNSKKNNRRLEDLTPWDRRGPYAQPSQST